MILGVLEYKIFVPIIKKETKVEKETENEEILYLSTTTKKSKKTIDAKCKRTNEGFVVLKDSMIELIDSDSLPRSIKKIRDKCKANNEIVDGRITKKLFIQ